MQSLLQIRLAAMVHRFADEQNGAAIGWRLPAQQIDGESQAVEDGGAAIFRLKAVQGVSHRIQIRGKGQSQTRFAVELHYRDLVGDAADDRLDRGAQVAILVELA